jgi:hypothetical protein
MTPLSLSSDLNYSKKKKKIQIRNEHDAIYFMSNGETVAAI